MIKVSPQRSELAGAFLSFRWAFFCVAAFSVLINILMLTGSFFMLQVYDRVLPSHSLPTLTALAILLIILLVAQGGLDWVRGRVLLRIGSALDEALGCRIFDATARVRHNPCLRSHGQQPLNDLETVRSFLGSPAASVVFDIPWLPFYLAIIFAFHTALGVTAIIGAIVLASMTILTEVLTRRPMRTAANLAIVQQQLAEAGHRNADVIASMGMAERLAARWRENHLHYVACQQQASDVIIGFGSMSRVTRLLVQSAVLAVGAYLVIIQEATAGIIIAGAILSARALAPIDLATTYWKAFVAARQSSRRLNDLMTRVPARRISMDYPRPSRVLSIEKASMALPTNNKVILQGINVVVESGQGLAVVGPSGSGKSTLMKLIVGAAEPTHGKVCLDGTSLAHWSQAKLGRHIGYVPQDVEFVPGTSVAETIARFEPTASSEAIIAAARSAGVHDLICGLPEGYETLLGDGNETLSTGQRQRVALARALFGNPFVVALDEPNSNLDAEGDAALNQAIQGVQARGGIIIIAAHRPSVLSHIDRVLALRHGRQAGFGPKEDVLAKILQPLSHSRTLPNVVKRSS